jgi:hypothetical protein
MIVADRPDHDFFDARLIGLAEEIHVDESDITLYLEYCVLRYTRYVDDKWRVALDVQAGTTAIADAGDDDWITVEAGLPPTPRHCDFWAALVAQSVALRRDAAAETHYNIISMIRDMIANDKDD